MHLKDDSLILNDKYRLVRLLGRGAFAQVYLARHLELEVDRAVKVLSRDAPRVGSTLFDEYQERFRLEARLGARLDHPHVVKVFDFEAEEDTLYLVMEYAPGGSVADLLDDEGALPPEDSLRIAADAAAGLGAIHAELGIVHRDVKPSNILLTEEGRAKIADLGLAQVEGGFSRRSMLGSEAAPHPGTPLYMSPEQEREYGYLQYPSDVYSLGCVMFEMLTGGRYKNQRPGTRVRDLRADAPAWIDSIVAQCVEEDRKARPWDGGEVAALLLRGTEELGVGRAQPEPETAIGPLQPETDTKPQGARTETARTAWMERMPTLNWVLGGLAVLVAMVVMAGALGVAWSLRGAPEPAPAAVDKTDVPVGTSATPSTSTATPPLPSAEPPPEEVQEPAEKMEQEILKLGVLGPFSGPSARTGDEFRAAAEMAFDAIDWTIGHYTIEPVWIDSQSDPADASQAYEQAVVRDGIQAAILNWHSSVAVSCMEIAARHQIPHFAPHGAAETVNETWQSDPDRYFYWVNKWWPTPEKLSVSYVQTLENAIETGRFEPDAKTVAIYGEDTAWGRRFGGAIKGQFEDAGWEIVSEHYFGIDQTEFYPLVNSYLDQDPAVIAGTSTALPSLSAFIRQADEVGVESVIIADGLGWFGDWYDQTGDSSNYVLDQIPGWATEEGRRFTVAFWAREGFEPSLSAAGLAFDGTNFFIQIAQTVYESEGELTSETLADFAKNQIQTGEWSYTDGIVMEEYLYTSETVPDPVVGEGYYTFPVLQYFDGEGQVIYPPEWAVQGFRGRP